MSLIKTTKGNPKPKTKTLPTSFDDFEQPLPLCPGCNSRKKVIKYGMRKIQNEPIQNYFCKTCEKKFNTRSIKHSPYPTHLILSALTYFNLGHTLQQTQTSIQRKYKSKIPISTLNNWVKRFEDDLSFIRLRKKFEINSNTTIHSKKFHHQQVYEFKYHTLKTNFSKRFFPQLKTYITSIHKTPHFIPNSAFQTGPRASQLRIDLKPQTTEAQSQEALMPSPPNIKPEITIEEFSNVDLRVATVVRAEKVPRAKKLLKLEVDLGQKRTIVAGIAEHYAPEDLAGKQILVVANLKPAKLMGIVSNGMLLAAVNDAGVTVATLDKPVDPGTQLR